jgi:hypothetical protein
MPDTRDPKGMPLALGIAAAIATAVAIAIYWLRLDRVVGLAGDDAWYVLLAKALATGHGYTLINSPTPGITPFYPPGFPALLAIFYAIFPHFPENVWLLKSVSIAAMLGSGVVAFRYFAELRALPTGAALALGFATAIYPPLVFLATSTVMSEGVFTFIQLAAIYWIEKSIRRDASGRACSAAPRDVAIGAALASLAFLSRSAGLGVLLGGGLYLLKERLAKAALIFAAVAAIAVGPWLLYAHSHAATPEQRVEQSGSIVLPYTAQLWQRVAGRPQSGAITWTDLPARVWSNLNEIGRADVGAFVLFSSYRPVEANELIQISDGAVSISLLLAFLALAGYITTARWRLTLAELVTPLALAVTLVWGWEQYRLILPLAPFIWFYLVMGVRQLVEICHERFAWPGPRGEELVLVAVSVSFAVSALDGNYRYLQRKFDPAPEGGVQWIRAFDENEAFIRSIVANVPGDAPIATDNPALVNLYTGRKTIASNEPVSRWQVWKHLGVRYVAKISPYPVELDSNESRFPTAYRHDGTLGLRLFDLGPPEARAAWGDAY